MADRDAFGREKGEDALADMGWSTGGTVAPDGGPVDVAAPERSGRAVRRRTNKGCAASVVTVGFVVVVLAVVVPATLDEIDDAIPTAPRTERPPPRGLEQRSMLRRGNLAPALRELRRVTEGTRLGLLRVNAESVLVTALVSGNRMRVARDTWDGEPTVLSTSPAGGVAGTAFPWEDVDASAPARIVRATTRGRGAQAFDYVVLLEAAGLRWSAFLKGGARYSAAPDGRQVSPAG